MPGPQVYESYPFTFYSTPFQIALEGGVLTPPRRPEGWPPYKRPQKECVGEGFIPPGT